jgi:hypothetical protein
MGSPFLENAFLTFFNLMSKCIAIPRGLQSTGAASSLALLNVFWDGLPNIAGRHPIKLWCGGYIFGFRRKRNAFKSQMDDKEKRVVHHSYRPLYR